MDHASREGLAHVCGDLFRHAQTPVLARRRTAPMASAAADRAARRAAKAAAAAKAAVMKQVRAIFGCALGQKSCHWWCEGACGAGGW